MNTTYIFVAPPSPSSGCSCSQSGRSCGARRRCARRRRPIFAGLGQTDSESTILASLCPSGVGKGSCAFENSSAAKITDLQTFLETAIQTRLIPDPTQSSIAQAIFESDASTNCTSYAESGAGGSSGANVASVVKKGAAISSAGIATGTAIAAAVTGAAVGSVVPVLGTIVGAIAGLIGGIFGAHHAAAVKGEQGDICTAVPAVNQAFEQIDSGLAAGSITASQAQSYYSQIQSQFTSALKQGTTYKTGDALWAFNLALEAVLQQRNLDLQSGTSSTGISASSPLLWLLLGGAALFLL